MVPLVSSRVRKLDILGKIKKFKRVKNFKHATYIKHNSDKHKQLNPQVEVFSAQSILLTGLCGIEVLSSDIYF
jgi:hypothetical protein